MNFWQSVKRISIVSSQDKSIRIYNLEDHNYTNHSLLTQTGTVPSKIKQSFVYGAFRKAAVLKKNTNVPGQNAHESKCRWWGSGSRMREVIRQLESRWLAVITVASNAVTGYSSRVMMRACGSSYDCCAFNLYLQITS